MSARTGFGEDFDSEHSPTLHKFTAASDEVHMLAELTAAMMKSQQGGTSYDRPKHRETGSRRESFATDSAAVETLPGGVEGVRRRRSTSRTRGRSSSNASTSTAGATLLEQLGSGGISANLRSQLLSMGGHGSNARATQRHTPGDQAGTAPGNMASLRRYVDDLSSQLRLARAKQETDLKVITELQQDNARLKQLVESANEVSEAATASLRELTRSRKTCEELRKEAEGLQRRAKAAERRCDQLQQLLQESKAQYSDVEQRAARAEVEALKSNERIEQVEVAAVRVEQALAVASENAQNTERRALRAEQVAAQEQARAADANQRAAKAEAAAAANHERLLDAERRAAKAEVLLEQLQAQILDLEGQAARNTRLMEEEMARAEASDRRAAQMEQAAAAADRRASRAEEELEQARALVAATERRAAIAEESIAEERSRAEAAEQRADRAEQAAEEDRRLALEAERRAGRTVQVQQEAEQRIVELDRRAVRAEQALQEAEARIADAERQAIRASEAKGMAEARALEAERRLQEMQAQSPEHKQRVERAEQARDEAVARATAAERRAARAEAAAEEAAAAISELEKRAERAEHTAEQDRKGAADADLHAARAQQALEQAQADALAAERRAARAEQALEEAREQISGAAARAARAEQLAAQERERAQEEARHAARMQAAAALDQQRAREADERAAAALVRAQKAETRISVMEGHAEALETRLQQATAQAGVAATRAADADRRCSRLGAEARELRKQLHVAVVQLVEGSDLHSPPQVPPFSPRRLQQPGDPDGSTSSQSVRQHSRGVEADVLPDPGPLSPPVSTLPAPAAPDSGGSRSQLWADAYSTPVQEHSLPHNTHSQGGADEVLLSQRGSVSARSSVVAAETQSGGGSAGARASSPSRLARVATPSSPGSSGAVATFEQFLDAATLAGELRSVRAELRSSRQELTDLKARHATACSRLQQLEEQAAAVEKLRPKLDRLAAQARESERFAAELRTARAQLAEMEGLQLELRKAQAELAEGQSMRAALDDARKQLVGMDRVQSESRRVAAALQAVTRERDAARNELAEMSTQLASLPVLRAQLQRAEAAAAEAEQAREATAAGATAAEAQLTKLKAQLAATEEELAEAVRRATRLQAAADEAAHQRDRVQASLGGAESALRALEEERASLAAAQERLKSKAKELVDAQEEIRLLKGQLQEAAAAHRRAAQAEQQAKAQAEEAQGVVSKIKVQLAQATAAHTDAAVLRQQLQTALAQVQTMKGDLNTAADRLASHAKLQAELAATVERADKAEGQLRNSNEDAARLKAQVEQLQRELTETRRALAKSKEELVAATALASSRGGRTAELEHEVAVLREKSYQLEVEVAGMTTELHRLKADLASASAMIEEAQSSRNQISDQLADATKQQNRAATAAAAAEERFRADLQQLQMRLAASEAECRALQHANGTLHDDLQRVKGDAMALQAQAQEEARRREEHANECRRLQRELDIASEGLVMAQRAQRSVVAGASELEAEVDQLRTSRTAIQAELEAAGTRVQRLQDEVRELTERNSELSGQLHGLSATVRHLEAENARLSDGHATLTVEMEARAVEARAARGEASELAADRARLIAEVEALRSELQHAEFKRSEAHGLRDPRITITGGGIPAVSDSAVGSPRRSVLFGQSPVDVSSPAPSASGTPEDLHALMVTPVDTGALMSDSVDLSQYEALLAALDEEAHQLDEELAGKEASSTVLLQRMRTTKQAVTARMDAMQAALQSAREAESELRRQAADKDIMILRLQQQLSQLGGPGVALDVGGAAGAEAAAGVGGAAAAAAGVGADVLQGGAVISALRQDLDATHERLREAGRQLREAQERAEAAEAEAGRLRELVNKARAEVEHLKGELQANDKVLGDAEAVILSLVEQTNAAKEAERGAVEASEALRAQVLMLQAQLEATLESAPSVPLSTEPSGGMMGATHERMVHYLSSLSPDGAIRPSSGGAADQSAFTTSSSPKPQRGSPARAMSVSLTEGVPRPLPTARRYPPGPRTSESGSAFSIRQGASNTELWDGLSASGWDDSAGGRSSGGGALNPAPVLLPAAGALMSSLQGAASPTGLHRLSDVSPKSEPATSSGAAAGATRGNAQSDAGARLDAQGSVALRPVARLSVDPHAPIGSPRAAAESPSAAGAGTAARGSVFQEILHSASREGATGFLAKARASIAASFATPTSTPGGTQSGGVVPVEVPQSPASPTASGPRRRRADAERSISSTRESLERVIGELNHRLLPAKSQTRLSSVGLPFHLPAIADEEPTARADPQAAVKEPSEPSARVESRPTAGSAEPMGRARPTSAADAVPSTGTESRPAAVGDAEQAPRIDPRSPVTGVMTQYSSSTLTKEHVHLVGSESPAAYPASVASTASNFELVVGTGTAAAVGSDTQNSGVSRPVARSSGLAAPQLSPPRAAGLPSRPPAVADASAALQSASYRLSPQPAARSSGGISVAVPGVAGPDDSHAVSRSGSFGVGSGSPMLSPRSTLESRTLSRAIRSIGESPGRGIAALTTRWSQSSPPPSDAPAATSTSARVLQSLVQVTPPPPLRSAQSLTSVPASRSPVASNVSRLLSGSRLHASDDTSRLAQRLAAMDDALKSIGAA